MYRFALSTQMNRKSITLTASSKKHIINGVHAQVVKLVDTPDLGSGAVRCVGSSPILGIFPETFSETTMFPVF